MITFLTIPRAFEGEFDALQRNAINSWRKAAPGCQVIAFGNEVAALPAFGLDLYLLRNIAYSPTGSPIVDTVFRDGDAHAFHDWICFASADIIFDTDLVAIVDSLRDVVRPLVIGQRRDIESGDGLRGAVLHAACGVDYFLYRRGTLGAVLPFTVRGGAGDNWLVWQALTTWRMTVIDATDSICALHVNHSHPEWANGKAGRQGSIEQRTNHALAFGDGMPRVHGVDSAPYALRNGEVVTR